MDIQVKLVNGKTMIPWRCLSEGTGYIKWDGEEKQIQQLSKRNSRKHYLQSAKSAFWHWGGYKLYF